MASNFVKLFIETGDKTFTQVVKLPDRFPYVIGRISPDLTIKDPNMSRKHCQLIIESGSLFIVDLGSSNGVEVNGSRVKRMGLKLDDHIVLGGTHIKVIQISIAAKKPRKGGKGF